MNWTNILQSIRGTISDKKFKTLIERQTIESTPRLTYFRYRPLFIVVFVLSFVLNFISALTAGMLEYDFVLFMVKNTATALLITGGTFLLIELTKRYILWLIFDDILVDGRCDNPGLIFFALLISVGVTTMAFFGAQKLVTETAAPPSLVETDTKDLDSQILFAQNTIDAAKEMKNHKGEVYWHAQETIKTQSETISELHKQKFELLKEIKLENKSIATNHESEVNTLSLNFGWITLGCELLLPLAILFLQWYKVQSKEEFDELKKMKNGAVQELLKGMNGAEYQNGKKKSVDVGSTLLQQSDGPPVIKHFSKIKNRDVYYTENQVHGMLNTELKRLEKYLKNRNEVAADQARKRAKYWETRLSEFQTTYHENH